MAKTLLDRIRASRQTVVKHGAWAFTVSRPTDMDMLDLQGGKLGQRELLSRFVIGWAGITELDVIPGGTGQPAEFSHELFSEWVADRPCLWEPLVTAIVDAYKKHEQEVSSASKN